MAINPGFLTSLYTSYPETPYAGSGRGVSNYIAATGNQRDRASRERMFGDEMAFRQAQADRAQQNAIDAQRWEAIQKLHESAVANDESGVALWGGRLGQLGYGVGAALSPSPEMMQPPAQTPQQQTTFAPETPSQQQAATSAVAPAQAPQPQSAFSPEEAADQRINEYLKRNRATNAEAADFESQLRRGATAPGYESGEARREGESFSEWSDRQDRFAGEQREVFDVLEGRAERAGRDGDEPMAQPMPSYGSAGAGPMAQPMPATSAMAPPEAFSPPRAPTPAGVMQGGLVVRDETGRPIYAMTPADMVEARVQKAHALMAPAIQHSDKGMPREFAAGASEMAEGMVRSGADPVEAAKAATDVFHKKEQLWTSRVNAQMVAQSKAVGMGSSNAKAKAQLMRQGVQDGLRDPAVRKAISDNDTYKSVLQSLDSGTAQGVRAGLMSLTVGLQGSRPTDKDYQNIANADSIMSRLQRWASENFSGDFPPEFVNRTKTFVRRLQLQKQRDLNDLAMKHAESFKRNPGHKEIWTDPDELDAISQNVYQGVAGFVAPDTSGRGKPSGDGGYRASESTARKGKAVEDSDDLSDIGGRSL